jgi:hypothetical protein
MSIFSAERLFLAGALLLVCLSGCGSHAKVTSGPPSVCLVREEGFAKAAVIKVAYDAGKLGTPKQLAKWFPTSRPAAYLEADGTLRPLSQLRGGTRLEYESWMNAYVQNLPTPLGAKVRAAADRVRESSINTGKPCKQVIQSS